MEKNKNMQGKPERRSLLTVCSISGQPYKDKISNKASECCRLNNSVNSNNGTKIGICREASIFMDYNLPLLKSRVTLKCYGHFKIIYSDTFKMNKLYLHL